MASNILLEAGTNEMELLIFRLGKIPFGINVAKVREIIQRPKTIGIPKAPNAVEGSFRLRDEVLTLVNLGRYFNMEGEHTQSGEGMIIIVEFNQLRCGVLVDTVEVICRLRWDQIAPPSDYLIDLRTPVTGTADVDNETVLIADFETIVSEILGLESAPDVDGTCVATRDRSDIRILLADDSVIIRQSLELILKKNGFENLTICHDGQQAWEAIEQARTNKDEEPFDLILSDIEMPRMDGLHLTMKVKDEPELKDIPVILFSSLITEDNRRKGESVGADAQVSKPNSQGMIEAVEELLEKAGKLKPEAVSA